MHKVLRTLALAGSLVVGLGVTTMLAMSFGFDGAAPDSLTTTTFALVIIAGGFAWMASAQRLIDEGISYVPPERYDRRRATAAAMVFRIAAWATNGVKYTLLSAVFIALSLGLVLLAKKAVDGAGNFLNLAPPEVSGSAIAAAAVLVAAVIGFVGSRYIEAQRSALEAQQAAQRLFYPRVVEFFADIRSTRTPADNAPARFDRLQRDAVLIASNKVLLLLADIAESLKEAGFDALERDSNRENELDGRIGMLWLAMRSDLGFPYTSAPEAEVWHRLDPFAREDDKGRHGFFASLGRHLK